MFDPEKNKLLCLPIEWADARIVVGSMKKKCAGCGRKVWVTPASMKMATENDCQIMCMICAAEQNTLEEAVLQPTPEQLKEIRKTLAEEN